MEIKSKQVIVLIMGQGRMCHGSIQQGPIFSHGWKSLKGEQDYLESWEKDKGRTSQAEEILQMKAPRKEKEVGVFTGERENGVLWDPAGEGSSSERERAIEAGRGWIVAGR